MASAGADAVSDDPPTIAQEIQRLIEERDSLRTQLAAAVQRSEGWREIARGRTTRDDVEAEVERLRTELAAMTAERDHWREARRNAMSACEMLAKQRDDARAERDRALAEVAKLTAAASVMHRLLMRAKACDDDTPTWAPHFRSRVLACLGNHEAPPEPATPPEVERLRALLVEASEHVPDPWPSSPTGLAGRIAAATRGATPPAEPCRHPLAGTAALAWCPRCGALGRAESRAGGAYEWRRPDASAPALALLVYMRGE
jgi:hypothetical protein